MVTIVVDVVLCLAAIFGLCVLGINAQRNETGLRGRTDFYAP
jgi:hypothetical protein